METHLISPIGSALRLAVSRLCYPVIFGGAVATIVVGVGSGASYWQVGPPVLVLAGMVVVLLERWLPFASAWQEDHGDTRTDILHFIGNVVVSHVSVLTYTTVSGFAHDALGSVWRHGWPWWAQFLLALLVFDLGLYAVHRASHGLGWLWRLHAIHHSPTRVYWVNGQRRHLVHEFIEGAPGLVVLGLLGAPSPIVASAIATITLHLMFQHANVAYRVGALRHVFAVAELHRWHHQRRWRDVQGNYSAVFSFWDTIFGTALNKAGDAPQDVGMDDEPTLPSTYLAQLAWPFTRRRRS